MDTILDDWRISILLIGLGLLLIFLEVFVPSGGILGVLALGFSGFGVYALFQGGHPVLALAAVAGVVTTFILGFRLGRERLGFKAVLAHPPPSTEALLAATLVGKTGVAQTALRPAGVVLIEGRKIDVVSKGQFIEAGAQVRVVEYSENRVIVVPAGAFAPDGNASN